jgi:hypothetical protein
MAIRHIVRQSPIFTPSPNGLLSVSEIRDDSDAHWQLGVTYPDLCGIAGTTYDECVSGLSPLVVPDPDPKTATTEHAYRGAAPFTVYTRIDCSPVGFWDDAQASVRRALERTESWAVERTVWTGSTPVTGGNLVYPSLTADADLTVNGIVLATTANVPVSGALAPAAALGELEAALANCYNGQGVIHVPARLIPTLAERDLLVRDGARLRTWNGNLVAAGNGYPGTGPGNTAPPTGAAWMYATGAVFVYRSDIFTTPNVASLNRETNTVEIIAERTYVAGWECCHFGVLTSLGVL